MRSLPGDDMSDLSPQLERIRDELDAATERAARVMEGLSEEQLKQRVEPNSWSVAECIVHLNLTSKEYLPLLDEALEQARQAGAAQGKLKMDVMGRLLKWALEPPPRMKTKTTNQFQPQNVEPIKELLPTFVGFQDQLKSRIQSAGSFAIDKVKITSPFNDRLKYNLFSAFHILLAHERRHIWQAEKVRKAIG